MFYFVGSLDGQFNGMLWFTVDSSYGNFRRLGQPDVSDAETSCFADSIRAEYVFSWRQDLSDAETFVAARAITNEPNTT